MGEKYHSITGGRFLDPTEAYGVEGNKIVTYDAKDKSRWFSEYKFEYSVRETFPIDKTTIVNYTGSNDVFVQTGNEKRFFYCFSTLV